MPAGMARLEVTFLVDADGILRVSAREETTGKEASIEVKPSYGLTDEEVERMLLDSFEHAEDDVKARLLAEQRVEAERILAAARAAMRRRARVARRPASATAIDARDGRARGGARRAPTTTRSARAIEELDHASKPFAERRMNRVDRAARQGVAEVDANVDEPSKSARPVKTPLARQDDGDRAQGQVRARRDSRSRCRSGPVDPRGVEQGARPGRLGLRRRLRLLDLPRLRASRGSTPCRRPSDREEDILDKAFDVKADVAARLSVEDRSATRRSSSRSAARAARRSSTSTPRSAPP